VGGRLIRLDQLGHSETAHTRSEAIKGAFTEVGSHLDGPVSCEQSGHPEHTSEGAFGHVVQSAVNKAVIQNMTFPKIFIAAGPVRCEQSGHPERSRRISS
jgi:hypothetical protein